MNCKNCKYYNKKWKLCQMYGEKVEMLETDNCTYKEVESE